MNQFDQGGRQEELLNGQDMLPDTQSDMQAESDFDAGFDDGEMSPDEPAPSPEETPAENLDDGDGAPSEAGSPDHAVPAPSLAPPAAPASPQFERPGPVTPEPTTPVTSPASIEAPEELAEELADLRRLNPRAADLALEDSPEGESIRRRLAEFGALPAQDRAETILERRDRTERERRANDERQRRAVEEHNKRFRAVIARDHPDLVELSADPARKVESARLVQDIFDWIGSMPYAEAAPLMEIARNGRDPEQVSALITRFKQERGQAAPKRPKPDGALAVPGRGAPSAPSGDVGNMDDFDAGFNLS